MFQREDSIILNKMEEVRKSDHKMGRIMEKWLVGWKCGFPPKTIGYPKKKFFCPFLGNNEKWQAFSELILEMIVR